MTQGCYKGQWENNEFGLKKPKYQFQLCPFLVLKLWAINPLDSFSLSFPIG